MNEGVSELETEAPEQAQPMRSTEPLKASWHSSSFAPGIVVSVRQWLTPEKPSHGRFSRELSERLNGKRTVLAVDDAAHQMLLEIQASRAPGSGHFEIVVRSTETAKSPLTAPPCDVALMGSPTSAGPEITAILREIKSLLRPEASIWVVLDNACFEPALAALMEGDATVGDGQREWISGRSTLPQAFKRILDAGWLPSLEHGSTAPPPRSPSQLSACASAAGQMLRQHDRLLIRARRFDADDSVNPVFLNRPRFAVVVPTNCERQLQANLLASPGLAQCGAKVVTVTGCRSPAQALQEAKEHLTEPWVLFIHQDVYLPEGFGERLNALLDHISPREAPHALIGFAGIGVNRKTKNSHRAGLVVDRIHVLDEPASDAALSLDELAVVFHRDTVHRLDPVLGWHLWATDLCLTAIKEHRTFAQIVRLPLFHNSTTGADLPRAFHESAALLLAKHPDFERIETLCGTIDAAFVRQGLARS